MLVLFSFYRGGMLQNLCKVTDQVCGEARFNYTKETLSKSAVRHYAWIASDAFWTIVWSGIWGGRRQGPDCSPPFPPPKHALLSFFVSWTWALSISSLLFHSEQLPMNFPQPHCSVNVSICRDSNSRVSRQLWLFCFCQTTWFYASYEKFIWK